MKIHCLTTFLDGRDRFEQGDTRTVDDADGARFVAAGWAEDLSGIQSTGAAVQGETSLDIHNSNLSSGDNHG